MKCLFKCAAVWTLCIGSAFAQSVSPSVKDEPVLSSRCAPASGGVTYRSAVNSLGGSEIQYSRSKILTGKLLRGADGVVLGATQGNKKMTYMIQGFDDDGITAVVWFGAKRQTVKVSYEEANITKEYLQSNTGLFSYSTSTVISEMSNKGLYNDDGKGSFGNPPPPSSFGADCAESRQEVCVQECDETQETWETLCGALTDIPFVGNTATAICRIAAQSSGRECRQTCREQSGCS